MPGENATTTRLLLIMRKAFFITVLTFANSAFATRRYSIAVPSLNNSSISKRFDFASDFWRFLSQVLSLYVGRIGRMRKGARQRYESELSTSWPRLLSRSLSLHTRSRSEDVDKLGPPNIGAGAVMLLHLASSGSHDDRQFHVNSGLAERIH